MIKTISDYTKITYYFNDEVRFTYKDFPYELNTVTGIIKHGRLNEDPLCFVSAIKEEKKKLGRSLTPLEMSEFSKNFFENLEKKSDEVMTCPFCKKENNFSECSMMSDIMDFETLAILVEEFLDEKED